MLCCRSKKFQLPVDIERSKTERLVDFGTSADSSQYGSQK